MKNVADIYPLAPMQELMLVHSLSAGESNLLFSHGVYIIKGELDEIIMERALSMLVDRHPILRTAFLWQGLEKAVQVVRKTVTLEWQTGDWCALDRQVQEERLRKFLLEDRVKGFDISRAPLIRFALFRIEDKSHFFVLSNHHLVLDRWCIAILMEEISSLYQAIRDGRPSNLEPIHPFRDYIAWLQQKDQSDAAAFWRAELHGIKAATRPPGYRRLAGGNGQPLDLAGYGESRLTLDPTATAALRAFAQRHHLTLSTVVLGGWALLHSSRAAGEDHLLGLTVSGRPPGVPGVESMIGSFINNIPIRISLPPEMRLVDWLKLVQKKQQTVQEFGYVSPLQLQEWSEIPPHERLAESLFVFQTPFRPPSAWPDMRPWEGSLKTSFPLTLVASEENGTEEEGLLLWAIYLRRYFEAETAAVLLEQLAALLTELVDQPEVVLADLMRVRRDHVWVEPTGKLDGRGPIPLSDSHAAPFQPPQNGVEARLLNIWEGIFDRRQISTSANFFDIGGTSLQAMSLMSQVEKAFQQRLPVTTVFTAPTIKQMAAALHNGAAPETWSTIVPIQTAGSHPPLFLVHHGGGTTFGYVDLARRLGNDQPLYGLQEPGLEDGQLPPESVKEIAALYVKEIRSLQPAGPYFLGGFCFGGIVAYEMAQQLQRAGEETGLLVLIDALNPGYEVEVTRETRLQRHINRLSELNLLQKAGYLIYRVARRSGYELLHRYRQVRDWLKLRLILLLERWNRPIPIPLRQIQLLYLNGRLNDEYLPDPYTGRVVLIRGIYPELYYNANFGWNEIVEEGVAVFELPTDDHVKMLLDPHVERLAGILNRELGAARSVWSERKEAL